MTRINAHLFVESEALRVRQVELRADDSVRRHYEKLARIVLDEMYQFVGLLDTEGTLLEVNRAALEGGGIRLADIQGKPFWEAHWWTVSRATQDELRRSVARAAQGEFVRYDVEVYGGAAGSETIVIDFSMIPVRDVDGRVVFLLAEGRNITEKKQAEAEIARKNQELEQLLARVRELDELKSQFFANVSHELRTPLALILGPADKILSDAESLTGSQRRDVEVIRRNAAMLLKHVNDLLDLAKLDAGQMTLDYAAVDLAALVRRTAGHFDALAPERQISFVVDTPDRLVAQVDPDKVERVLLNLLSNAFKFTPEGGRVKCELRLAEDGLALLSVQDSGPGVRPELRHVIFERFRQGDGGSNRKFGGTGLGLSIAKDFVGLHAGTIGVTESPGGGALFLVEVPTRAPAGSRIRVDTEVGESPSAEGALEELRPVEAAQASGSGADVPLVLVVEDNPELNRFIAEALSEDHRVVSAYDGEEGLERALAFLPDLVVSDIMMPRMSGDEMIAQIRRRNELDGVPILVLSAKADDRLRNRLLREGAHDYVTKPFSAEELRARVVNLVSAKRTRELLRRELASQSFDLEELAGELVRRQRERDLALAHAEAASRAKSAFLSTMSHELRTPLNGIIGYVDLMDAEIAGPVTPTQRSYLDRVRASGQHLVSLVGDILDMGKIEAGRVELFPRALRADEAVDAAVALVRPQAQAKRLDLRSACRAGRDVMLHADPERLRQILVNVIGNAVKFTEPSGRITVTCGLLAEPAYGAVPEGEGPWAVIRVQDTGIGIAAEQMEHIWQPFEQADAGHTRPHDGTGLGLTISRSLARLMGGDLVAHSEPGAGSTFLLILPTAAAGRSGMPDRRGRERHAEGISVVGDTVLAEVERIVHGYLARLRTDPDVPSAWTMSEAALEDHAATLLVDIAEAVNAVDEAAGAPSQIVRDAQEIQRSVAERHGQNRARFGWSRAELKRDYEILREELERAVRRRAEREAQEPAVLDAAGVEHGLALFARFIERAQETSLEVLDRG